MTGGKQVAQGLDRGLSVFVIMPFHADFDDVYDAIGLASKAAFVDEPCHCFRASDISAAGNINDDMVRAIKSANFCVADITGNNPNVLWELGYAMALQKPVVLMSQDVQRAPFDIANLRILQYSAKSIAKMRTTLVDAMQSTAARYELGRADESHVAHRRPTARTIALTGSSSVEPAKCRRRLEELLAPYLGRSCQWYVGSLGTTDETAIELLVSKGEQVVVVGYGQWDISDKMRGLVKKLEVPFLDAELEQVPAGLDGPSKRDSFMLAKSDLVITIWNGRSMGTRTLIDWYRAVGRDILVGFV